MWRQGQPWSQAELSPACPASCWRIGLFWFCSWKYALKAGCLGTVGTVPPSGGAHAQTVASYALALLLQQDSAGRRGDGFAPGQGSGQGPAPSHRRQSCFLGRAATRLPVAVPAAPPSCTRWLSQSGTVPVSCVC